MLIIGPQETLKHFLERWLEDVHQFSIRPGTVVKYRTIIRRHLAPALGHIPMQKLALQHLQSFYAQKQREGKSSGTIRNIHQVLHTALDYALREGLIARNVSDAVVLPRKKRHEIQVLTREQAQRLLEVARGHRIEVLLTVALTTGLRRGELLGLHWQDIDFTNRCLYVRRTVSYQTGKGYVEAEPKTVKSRRKIVLPLFVLDKLKQHRADQEKLREKADGQWVEHNLVFCNFYGGYFAETRLFYAFRKLLRAAGLPKIRFHDLRHSAATIFLAMGVHPKVVQELLGHSQISVTLDTYSHVLSSMQEDVMTKLNDLYQGDSIPDPLDQNKDDDE